jgi:hypothetical protein
MKENKIAFQVLVIVVSICLAPAAAFAQQAPMIYPAKGQSQSQMDKDKYECYGWAKKQSGFDPMQAGSTQQSAPATPAPGGERVRGAARGAAVGAVAGGIAGDAGKGAAAGAAAGTMAGGMRQRDKQRQAAAAQQQQQTALAQNQSNYNRAFGACMEGRGYTVK